MKRGLSQETLKLIACLTMLLDHIGAVFMPGSVLRDIGRLSFPIFCFLLSEGVFHTRDPRKYALRLTLGMFLAELPFDFAFYGGIHWGHQNVMLTLLLGFLALWAGKGLQRRGPLELLVAVPFVILGDVLCADYGSMGVMLILLLGWTREMPYTSLFRFLGMLFLFGRSPGIAVLRLGSLVITQQMLGAAAILPISLYSGEKRTASKGVQLAFYLFYPVHLIALYLIA